MPTVWHQKNGIAIGQVFTMHDFAAICGILKRYAGKIFKNRNFTAEVRKLG
jgi:hypothetical protein